MTADRVGRPNQASERVLHVVATGAAIGALASAAASTLIVAARRAREPRETFPGRDGTTHRLNGAVLERYRTEGGPTGRLGAPLTGLQLVRPDPQVPLAADRESRFTHGVIYLHTLTGATMVLAHDTEQPVLPRGTDLVVGRPPTGSD